MEIKQSSEESSGIPGLLGTQHIGFTVPNLAEATHFFVEVLGCEQFFDRGPFQRTDNWMLQNLNVHPRAVMKKLRWFRCKNGSNFEVFEYEVLKQRTDQPKNSDIGGHHLALQVEDIDAAVRHLRAHGIRFLGEPKTTEPPAPNAGMRWVYFLSPWGMQFELISIPVSSVSDQWSGLWCPRNSPSN